MNDVRDRAREQVEGDFMPERQSLAIIAESLSKLVIEQRETNRRLEEIATRLPQKPPGNFPLPGS
jgi:hypothetical protein